MHDLTPNTMTFCLPTSCKLLFADIARRKDHPQLEKVLTGKELGEDLVLELIHCELAPVLILGLQQQLQRIPPAGRRRLRRVVRLRVPN